MCFRGIERSSRYCQGCGAWPSNGLSRRQPRLTNVLRRLHHERWADVMFVRVDEFVLVDGVGIGTFGQALAAQAVELGDVGPAHGQD